MKTVFVQIIDTNNCIFQHGVISEPVQKGFEIANAIGHFGVNINTVKWNSDFTSESKAKILNGDIEGTSKIINVVVI